MEYNEEIQEQDLVEENETGSIKQWLQDNLRIIISALVVVVIAAGIYSYSSRTEDSEIVSEETGGLLSEVTEEKQIQTEENDQKKEEAPAQKESEQASQDQKIETGKDEKVSSSSRETESSFAETAVQGDGTTKMARRALANYLEKNTDSSLTAEHKIYIEDYMRKHIPQKRVRAGDSVEFQKSLIEEAISKSKSLSENQLQNLHKYAVRVPSLT